MMLIYGPGPVPSSSGPSFSGKHLQARTSGRSPCASSSCRSLGKRLLRRGLNRLTKDGREDTREDMVGTGGWRGGGLDGFVIVIVDGLRKIQDGIDACSDVLATGRDKRADMTR